MKKALLLCALGTAFLAAQAAYADTVAGNATYSDSGTNDLTVYGTIENGGSFSYSPVTANGPAVVDSNFLYLQTYIFSDKTQNVSDTVSVTFDITDPAAGNGILGGGVTEDQVQLLGVIDEHSGIVTWNSPLAIMLANGDTLDVSLADIALPTTITLLNNPCAPYDTCGYDAATFQLTGPTAAPTPEPGSLALLGTSVLGAAGLLRRKFSL